ncbi:MAG: PQQ-binding-like beta-propeller repeat protein [Planctomycetota bacterium]|nr:PQQ-binding-like beta-propeller repeat protein [Planctomycetota bacterium]
MIHPVSLVRLSAILVVLQTSWLSLAVHSDDWPQWRGPNRDGQWNETGLIKKFDKPQIPKKWSVKIGSGYSGPTVAEGRVLVMDRLTEPEQVEQVLCFDEKTGKRLWKYTYECEYRNVGYVAGPRSSVTIDGERAYSIGTMGHLKCLNVKNGELVWQHDCDHEYRISEDKRMPIWGIAASPLIYKNLLIIHIGAVKASLVAFDKLTGKEVWRSLSDRAQYSSPILVNQAGSDVCVIWTGDNVVGVNPTTGKPYWQIPLKPRNMPIGVATPVTHNQHLFVTSFYDGAMMVKLNSESPPSAKLVWRKVGRNERKTEAIHSIISTPVFSGNYIFGMDSYGEFRCIKALDGSRVWEDQTAVPKARWSTIHFVENGDKTWMFNERGELIIARLSSEGFEEISRAKLIEPTLKQLRQRKGVCWSHPAFANQCIFARNDFELVCADLSAK